jgi:hypothetical protein
MALSGPQHYAKADELLAEIEAVPTLANETRDGALRPRRGARDPRRRGRLRPRPRRLWSAQPGVARDRRDEAGPVARVPVREAQAHASAERGGVAARIRVNGV